MIDEKQYKKCEKRGRHEYIPVRDNANEFIGYCRCGTTIRENRRIYK